MSRHVSCHPSLSLHYVWPVIRLCLVSCLTSPCLSPQDACHNYIRVLAKTGKDQLFVCGTNSYKPRCRSYKKNPVRSPSLCRYSVLSFPTLMQINPLSLMLECLSRPNGPWHRFPIEGLPGLYWPMRVSPRSKWLQQVCPICWSVSRAALTRVRATELVIWRVITVAQFTQPCKQRYPTVWIGWRGTNVASRFKQRDPGCADALSVSEMCIFNINIFA